MASQVTDLLGDEKAGGINEAEKGEGSEQAIDPNRDAALSQTSHDPNDPLNWPLWLKVSLIP